MSNVGKIDRIVRAVLGVVLIGAGIYYTCWIAGIVGLVLVTTAAISFCPLYAVFKCSTVCEKKEEEK